MDSYLQKCVVLNINLFIFSSYNKVLRKEINALMNNNNISENDVVV